MIRRHIWTLDLTVVAVCAVMLSRASAGLVESRLPRIPRAEAPPRTAAASGSDSSGASTPAISNVPSQRPTASAPPSNDLPTELDAGIKKVGAHSYEIRRQTLEWVRRNLKLSRWARVVPEIRDGRVAGFRLYAVRPDSLLARLGMQTGDVIVSIDGLEITSPERALEVYAKLGSARPWTVEVERNGQRITMEYLVR